MEEYYKMFWRNSSGGIDTWLTPSQEQVKSYTNFLNNCGMRLLKVIKYTDTATGLKTKTIYHE